MKAKRIDFHPDNIPMVEPRRSVEKCGECGQIQAHDYIPYSFGQGVVFNPCSCRAVAGSNWKRKTLDTYNRSEL